MPKKDTHNSYKIIFETLDENNLKKISRELSVNVEKKAIGFFIHASLMAKPYRPSANDQKSDVCIWGEESFFYSGRKVAAILSLDIRVDIQTISEREYQ